MLLTEFMPQSLLASVSGNLGIGTTNPTDLFQVAALTANADFSGRVDSDNASHRPSFRFVRSGTSFTSPSPTDARLGLISFAGYNSLSSLQTYSFIDSFLSGAPTATNSNSYLRFFTTNGASGGERLRINGNGNVGIGTSVPNETLTVAGNISAAGGVLIGSGTTTQAPLRLTSGSNLSVSAAGAIEYDGTTFYATPNTNFGRAAIPATIYTGGAGPSIAVASDETVYTNLFPVPNDTIFLSTGTYYVKLKAKITRAASGTNASLKIKFTPGGAVYTFSGIAYVSLFQSGNVVGHMAEISTNQDIFTSGTSNAQGGVYWTHTEGVLKVTTAGTITPQWALTSNLAPGTGSTTSTSFNYMLIQTLDTNSATDFGPTGSSWI